MLNRNDIPWAVAVYRRRLMEGTYTPEVAQMLLMLQDDPSKLMAELVIVNRDPAVAARLRSMGNPSPPPAPGK